MKIQQWIDGELKYEADIEKYQHSVPHFIKNGATKITIEYPTSTVIIIPNENSK